LQFAPALQGRTHQGLCPQLQSFHEVLRSPHGQSFWPFLALRLLPIFTTARQVACGSLLLRFATSKHIFLEPIICGVEPCPPCPSQVGLHQQHPALHSDHTRLVHCFVQVPLAFQGLVQGTSNAVVVPKPGFKLKGRLKLDIRNVKAPQGVDGKLQPRQAAHRLPEHSCPGK